MNGALWDDWIRSGNVDLIPPDLLAKYGVGRDRAARIMEHLCLNADPQLRVWWSAQRLAATLRIPDRHVREVLAMYVEAGFLVRLGYRERAVLYAIDPTAWGSDPARDVARDIARDIARESARIRATKGSEEKRTPLPPADAGGGGRRSRRRQPPASVTRIPHPLEPNVRAAIAKGRLRELRLTDEEALDLCYETAKGGDLFYDGYMRLRHIAESGLGDDIRNPLALVRHRLGVSA